MMKHYRFLLVLAILLSQTNSGYSQTDSLIHHNGQPLFMSGMNLAWMNFADDLGNFNETLFTQRVEDLAAAGGNTIRWWLHTNGRHSPQFSNGMVSGINPQEIANLKLALDIAFERGVLLMLCLWSFDMLQPNAQEANWPRNRALLENSSQTQAYIDNALIPMVEALKGHPGIACWEIFNEPEGMINGFGWTPQKVDFIHVQRFVNMTAGAIKRTDPDTKVSNGSWNIRVLTDIGSFTNYYRDDRLIAAGGDTLGVLDFYMTHYYPQHFGANQSPFHNHASHWQLDRPLLIGEFPSLGINLTNRTLTTLEAYQYAIENGYAGALSWTMTGHDGNGGLPESTEAMLYLQETYPELINVIPDPDFPYPPYIKEGIQPFFTPLQEQNNIFPLDNLNDIFGHPNEGMPLEFTIHSNSNPGLISATISGDDTLKVEVFASVTGLADLVVRATDTLGKSINARVSISVFDPQSHDQLLFRSAKASSEENDNHLASFAIDGNQQTRWSSMYADNQWLAVEMEEEKTITRVMLRWETAFGRNYTIDVSGDGKDWTTIYHEPLGNGGWDKIIFEPVTARFIRMNGIQRATAWGFSLWSFEAFKDEGENTPPVFSGEFKDTLARAAEAYNAVIPLSLVTDPDLGERLFFDVSYADADGKPHWLDFDWITRTLSGTPTVDDIGEVYAMKLTVTDMSGESDTHFFNLYVESGTGISSNIFDSNFLVYPNPAQTHLTIKGNYSFEDIPKIRLLDTKGTQWYENATDKFDINGKTIDVSHLLPGIYFLEISAINHREIVRFSKL